MWKKNGETEDRNYFTSFSKIMGKEIENLLQ